METVREFVDIANCQGYGDGYGSGYDDGSGYGDGYGSGYGDGYGSGYGHGSGYCDGSGYGDGYGSGNGDGYGSGNGSGNGLKTYNGKAVYMIDGLQTIIDKVRFGFGVGWIINRDLTLSPCFVARRGNLSAHGETMRAAREALIEKLFDGMSEDERIAAFWECHDRTDKYSGRDLWEWHHKLTGSCEMGRNQFAADHGIDIDNSAFTVAEFVELCKDAYGGSTIRKLRKAEDFS